MAKNVFTDWDTTASNNTDIGGIGILGSNAVSNFDDALRTVMAQLRSGVDGKVVYAAKSANYTAVLNDNNGYFRFTAAATLSLTAVATLGSNWHIFVQADGGDVTVDPNASETINGATTIVIRNGESAIIVSNGSAFFARVSPAAIVYASKSGNYTALPSDNGAVHRYTADATATLTAAATLGSNWRYTIVADGGAVTIDPNGSETISGLATQIVPNGSAATIICDGSNFFFTNIPTGWRAIRTVSFSAASAIDMTDLGQYSRLRITGFMGTSGSTALLWRTSTNNGSSYDAGASDYSYQAIGADNTTLNGARSNAANSGLISAASLNQAQFTFTLDAFNNASYGVHGQSYCMAANSGVPQLQIIGGFRLAEGARNALRILPSAAVTMTGNLILEGALV